MLINIFYHRERVVRHYHCARKCLNGGSFSRHAQDYEMGRGVEYLIFYCVYVLSIAPVF